MSGPVIPCAPGHICAGAGHGRGRVHYIQAEVLQWDYAPGGLVDRCTGQKLDEETAVRPEILLKASCFTYVHVCIGRIWTGCRQHRCAAAGKLQANQW